MTILKWDISNGDTIVSLASVSQGDMKDRPPCSSAWKGESEHSYSASQQCITLEISGDERNDTRGKLRSRPFLQLKFRKVLALKIDSEDRNCPIFYHS